MTQRIGARRLYPSSPPLHTDSVVEVAVGPVGLVGASRLLYLA